VKARAEKGATNTRKVNGAEKYGEKFGQVRRLGVERSEMKRS
jgi:hypothetical protein